MADGVGFLVAVEVQAEMLHEADVTIYTNCGQHVPPTMQFGYNTPWQANLSSEATQLVTVMDIH